jgi:hypothetical protein
MSVYEIGKDLSSAVGRWSGLGPYYAMFPIPFAFQVIREYSIPGDIVIDPFSGRGTSVYAAAMQQRIGVGVEINPVGWLYGRVKLRPASEERVLKRLDELAILASASDSAEHDTLPEFFHHCYSPTILSFLLQARQKLDWRQRIVDATLMSFILVYLHGKDGAALSNQMRQGKAMSPEYSVRWWREHGKRPPDVDPAHFLASRIRWRYSKGCPERTRSRVLLGDSTRVVPGLAAKLGGEKARLLFTSPPYYMVTNYHYDQWLRLWMLGGPDRPCGGRGEWQRKFYSKEGYERLLTTVFLDCKQILSRDAVVYVRTDARPFTLETTKQVLASTFSDRRMECIDRPLTRSSQTALFGDKQLKPGEVDIVLA